MVVVECGEQRARRPWVADLAERVGGRAAHLAVIVVVQSADQGIDGPGTDLDQSPCRVGADPFIPGSGDERIDSGDLDALSPLAPGDPVGRSGRAVVRTPAKPVQRLRGGAAHEPLLLAESRDEGSNRPGITEPTERVGGVTTHGPVSVAECGDEGRNSPAVAELAKRCKDMLAHGVFLVVDGGEQGVDGTGIAQLAERGGGVLANQRLLVVENGQERADGPGVADLAERGGGVHAYAPVAVPKRDRERAHRPRVTEPAQRPSGNLPDPALFRMTKKPDQHLRILAGGERADVWASEQQHLPNPLQARRADPHTHSSPLPGTGQKVPLSDRNLHR